jgi:hypothetical protein
VDGTTTAKWKTAKGILETATPHRVSLCETILSRKGRGKDHGDGKSFISFWIAMVDEVHPRK